MPFFPWKCADCGKGGSIRHKKGASQQQIMAVAGEVHAEKSPECHAKEVMRQTAILRVDGLKLRDRHLLISARIKRRLMADALREMRGSASAPAERSGDTWAAWLAKVGPKREMVRMQFIQAKKLRNGYAFT